jgi:hypothetical protein
MSDSDTINRLTATETHWNWAAMFTAYANGSKLEEIATIFACPMPVLRRAAMTQDWATMSAKLVVPEARDMPEITENRLARLEANRAKNYDLADILREKLMKDFIALKNGTLKVERCVAYKGEVHHTEVEPGPQDMVALANAAKSVAEMTYRALGDVAAEDRQITQGKNNDSASITVILPTVVHHTGSKDDAKPVEVIDLRPPASTEKPGRITKAISEASVITPNARPN